MCPVGRMTFTASTNWAPCHLFKINVTMPFADMPDANSGETYADLNNPSDTEGQLIAASKVNGTAECTNTAGEKLGSMDDVMLDKVSGKADYAIMSFGGFLGIGDRYHPLPWKALTGTTCVKEDTWSI